MATFESLRYRDFRLLWTGATFSNVGTWMQNVALSWYVLVLTGSPFWVGAVTFATFIPMVLAPLGGITADRLDRRKVLLATQCFLMLDAAALAALAQTGHATLWAVLTLTLGVGVAYALNAPTWHAFVANLVPRHALVNAVALNSAQFSVARVVGPAIAGTLIAAAGLTVVFWINAASFVAVLVALFRIRPRAVPATRGATPAARLATGVRYAWGDPTVRAMILSIGVFSFFGAPISALLPVYARDVFHRGPGAFGSLAAAMGLGAVIGALALGRLGRASQPIIGGALVVLGAALTAFAGAPVYGAGLALMVVVGSAYLFAVSGINSAIQTTVDDGVRGRVMSLFMLAFGALFPLGSLAAGAVADRVGVVLPTVASAAACGLWGLGLVQRWRRRVARELRPASAAG